MRGTCSFGRGLRWVLFKELRVCTHLDGPGGARMFVAIVGRHSWAGWQAYGCACGWRVAQVFNPTNDCLLLHTK